MGRAVLAAIRPVVNAATRVIERYEIKPADIGDGVGCAAVELDLAGPLPLAAIAEAYAAYWKLAVPDGESGSSSGSEFGGSTGS